MDQLSSILWLVLGVAFIIAEIFTLGFVLFWFGIDFYTKFHYSGPPKS